MKIKVRRVKVTNRTNPNLLQLSWIARKDEWKSLIKYLEKYEGDNSAIEDAYNCLKEVVLDGASESDSREFIEADIP